MVKSVTKTKSAKNYKRDMVLYSTLLAASLIAMVILVTYLFTGDFTDEPASVNTPDTPAQSGPNSESDKDNKPGTNGAPNKKENRN